MVRQPLPLGVLRVSVLLVLAACGGGGATGGAPPAGSQPPTSTRIATTGAVLTLDATGLVTSLQVGSSGTEVAAPTAEPLLEVEQDGSVLVPTGVRRVGEDLVAAFADAAVEVRLAVETTSGSIVFRLAQVTGDGVTAVRLRVPVRLLAASDSALSGTYDDEVAVCVRSLTEGTMCLYSAAAGVARPGVEWSARHGLAGAAALVASPRADFLGLVNSLEAAEGLPSPQFDGVPARVSPTVRSSYLFLTYYHPDHLDRVIAYARAGGFGLVMFLRGLWCVSEGTFAPSPVNFPGGVADLVATANSLHEAGLGMGLHLYGPSVLASDPLVAPVPSPGLFRVPLGALADAVDAAADTLRLVGPADLPDAGLGGFPGSLLCVGNEIVRYGSTQDDGARGFAGCERGAQGTAAASHAAGTPVEHLLQIYDQILIDPDAPLVDTVGANLASVVNAAGIDMLYFDGTAVVPTSGVVERWSYMNHLMTAWYAAFDHPVLVQTAMGPGRDLLWHMVPRSASADGHGDIKWYLDRRTPSIDTIRRGFAVPDVGWYAFGSGRPPDYLEYVAARCLAWSCPLSVQSHVLQLEADPWARETIDMLARYERRKRAQPLDADTTAWLLTPGRDVRLLEDDGGDFHLYEAAYDAERDCRTLSGGAYGWSVVEPSPAPRPVEFELRRGAAIAAAADLSATGAFFVDLFRDAGPYVPGPTNDADRLVQRTEKVMGAAGPARLGVTHALVVADDPAVGGACLELQASNAGSGIGWCAVGRTFDPVVDVATATAFGVWVKGDHSGITLTFELWDDADVRATMAVPVFFSGWRLYTFPFAAPAGFDRSALRYLVLVASDLPPGGSVALRVAALKATPTVNAPEDLSGLTLTVGSRAIPLDLVLPPFSTARIDALGRLVAWPGGMAEPATSVLDGGPVMLPTGTVPLRLDVADPSSWPGDLTIRVVRLTPR